MSGHLYIFVWNVYKLRTFLEFAFHQFTSREVKTGDKISERVFRTLNRVPQQQLAVINDWNIPTSPGRQLRSPRPWACTVCSTSYVLRVQNISIIFHLILHTVDFVDIRHLTYKLKFAARFSFGPYWSDITPTLHEAQIKCCKKSHNSPVLRLK